MELPPGLPPENNYGIKEFLAIAWFIFAAMAAGVSIAVILNKMREK
jgi:hypothetical protein